MLSKIGDILPPQKLCICSIRKHFPWLTAPPVCFASAHRLFPCVASGVVARRINMFLSALYWGGLGCGIAHEAWCDCVVIYVASGSRCTLAVGPFSTLGSGMRTENIHATETM